MEARIADILAKEVIKLKFSVEVEIFGTGDTRGAVAIRATERDKLSGGVVSKAAEAV